MNCKKTLLYKEAASLALRGLLALLDQKYVSASKEEVQNVDFYFVDTGAHWTTRTSWCNGCKGMLRFIFSENRLYLSGW